jgi:hypothetical protein
MRGQFALAAPVAPAGVLSDQPEDQRLDLGGDGRAATPGLVPAGRCPPSRLPRPAVLATGREALPIAGKRPWGMPSLALAEAANLPPLADLAYFEAVRLFVEHSEGGEAWHAAYPVLLVDDTEEATLQGDFIERLIFQPRQPVCRCPAAAPRSP